MNGGLWRHYVIQCQLTNLTFDPLENSWRSIIERHFPSSVSNFTPKTSRKIRLAWTQGYCWEVYTLYTRTMHMQKNSITKLSNPDVFTSRRRKRLDVGSYIISALITWRSREHRRKSRHCPTGDHLVIRSVLESKQGSVRPSSCHVSKLPGQAIWKNICNFFIHFSFELFVVVVVVWVVVKWWWWPGHSTKISIIISNSFCIIFSPHTKYYQNRMKNTEKE